MSFKESEENVYLYKKITRDLVTVQNRLFTQLESLSWIQNNIKLNYSLPATRGWSSSPDVLLKLYEYVRYCKVNKIVELGSGVSTIVLAAAIRDNGGGKLYSFEHNIEYLENTRNELEKNELSHFVDLRLAKTNVIDDDEMKYSDAIQEWYDLSKFSDLKDIDLLWVDGPPQALCTHSRFPALPVLNEKMSSNGQIWMDDTIRKEEREICEKWAKMFSLSLVYSKLEKGLGVLKKL